MIKLDRNHKELNEAIQNEFKNAIEDKPIEGSRRKLVIKNVKFEGKDHTYNELANIIASKKSAYAKVKGDIHLIDKATGQTEHVEKGAHLGNLPLVTKKGTFVVNGTSYVIPHQLRLKPGAYTTIKQNGDTETFFNPKQGVPFKIVTSGDKGDVSFSFGGRKYNMIDVLRIMGLSDKEIEKKIGKDVFNELSKKSDVNKTAKSLAEKMRIAIPKDAASPELLYSQIREAFNKMKLDPSVAKTTLGIEKSNIDGHTLLHALKKNIYVAKTGNEDDKENLMFKRVVPPEKLLTEGSLKLMGKDIAKMKWMLNTPIKQDIASIVKKPIVGTRPMDFVTTAAISRMPEEYNRLQVKQVQSDITPLGEGGISSSDMVTPSVRALHPSQLGFIDPIKSPEGANTGVTLSTTHGAHIDEHGNPHIRVKNLKTGKIEIKPIKDIWDKKLAFPDPDKHGNVGIREGHKIYEGKLKNADYQLVHSEDMYGPAMNALGMINANDPTRNLMASKHILQALPLVHRDNAPVVLKGEKGAMDEELAKKILPIAPASGVVTKINQKDGLIYIKDQDGKIHKESFASEPVQLNSKTFLEHRPIVKVGDKVKKGQVLADSNNTKGGRLALGKNVRTAWMMYPGTRNDAVVISESAAKKLASEHSAKFDINDDKTGEMDKKKFMTLFPEIAQKYNMENYDEKGVVKPGVKLHKGDPVAFRVRKLDEHEAKFENSKIKKLLYGGYVPEIHEWKYKNPGELNSVKRKGNKVRITAKYTAPAEIGDKLTGRSGNKGIIGQILPDHEMPRDEEGKPIDVILGGASVVSRINPGQIIEAALGEVSRKTGKRYVLDHYPDEKMADFAKREAQKHNVKLYHKVYDPVRKIYLEKPVFIGNYHMFKLFKQGENAWSAVGRGAVDGLKQPKKGGKESAATISNMEINSLLSHDARDFLREAYHIRSQENKDWFKAFERGAPLPVPEEKASVNRFRALLSQMNVKLSEDHEGNRILLPMTDKDVLKMSSGEVKSGTGLKLNTMEPQKGGIYDTKIFGHSGTQYGHIDLKEKFLNPLYYDEIGKILGKTNSEIQRMVAEGRTDELKRELSRINIDKAIEYQKKLLKGTTNPNDANKLVRTIKTLKKFKNEGIKPQEAMFISKVPVLPISHRPIAKLPNGELLTHDVNFHYKNIIDSVSALKEAKQMKAPESILNSLRSEVQEHLGAMYGTNPSPDPKLRNKNVKGILDVVGGKNPKHSFWHKNILRNRVFTSGRAVVTPHNKNLSMDMAEIPEDIAWKIYEPHIKRKMSQAGVDPFKAEEMIKNKHDSARHALEEVMKEVPIVVNRPPSLHKHNFTGHYAKITHGSTMNLPPEIENMHNMDYDGDQLAIHVPLTQAAIRDVKEKLLPSKQLFSAASNNALIAGMDLDPYIGFYEATKKKHKRLKK